MEITYYLFERISKEILTFEIKKHNLYRGWIL